MGEKRIKRWISRGKCSLCGGTFSKAGMTKHLKSCRRRKDVSETLSDKRRLKKTMTFHLVVDGYYQPEYWMHLEARADATLEDLDYLLRDEWLECCGHMSAFTIQGRRYITGAGIDLMWMDIGMVPGGVDMDITLDEVLASGMKFYHEYDFGTTTLLTLRVVAEHEGEIGDEPIQILAVNDPPLITCVSCGKTARHVCTQCMWSGEGWLCDKCAGAHECGEEMLLPMVNSPRVGTCGYTGETEAW